MNPETLASELADALVRPRVEALGPALLSVSIPDFRLVHGTQQILVEVKPEGGGFRLLDAAELGRRLEDDRDQVVNWLSCAGADVTIDGDFVVTEVETAGELAPRILSFAQYLLAAPVLWQAEPCMADEGEAVEREPSAVERMANEARNRIRARIGDRALGLIRRKCTVKGHGQRAVAPLAVGAPKSTHPRLVATFIDDEAGPQSASQARRSASWLFQVINELEIPKYLMVRGPWESEKQLQATFEPQNVTTLPFDDGEIMIDDVQRIATELVGR